MIEQAIEQAVSQYVSLACAAGIAVQTVVLFGSFARGEGDDESDIDLVVIAPQFDEADDRVIDLLWELRALTDSRIEPIACGVEQWVTDRSNPLLEIARREGIVLSVEAAAL